jgi:hypothetical protein
MHRHRPLQVNDLFAREAELRALFNQNRVHFLLIELDTGATFCGVAKSATDPEKIERNVRNARTAHDTAVRFAREAHFDAKTKIEFDEKLDILKCLLTSLGEHL